MQFKMSEKWQIMNNVVNNFLKMYTTLISRNISKNGSFKWELLADKKSNKKG